MFNFNLIVSLVIIYSHIILFTCGFFSSAHPIVPSTTTTKSPSHIDITPDNFLIKNLTTIGIDLNPNKTSGGGECPEGHFFICDDDSLITKIFKYIMAGILWGYVSTLVVLICEIAAGAISLIFLYLRYTYFFIIAYVVRKIDEGKRRKRRLLNQKRILPRENEIGGELRGFHRTTILPLLLFIGDHEYESKNMERVTVITTTADINVGNSEEHSRKIQDQVEVQERVQVQVHEQVQKNVQDKLQEELQEKLQENPQEELQEELQKNIQDEQQVRLQELQENVQEKDEEQERLKEKLQQELREKLQKELHEELHVKLQEKKQEDIELQEYPHIGESTNLRSESPATHSSPNTSHISTSSNLTSNNSKSPNSSTTPTNHYIYY